ncbi:hypothetical protein SAMN04490244_101509 [Tranquillimonas rosea]|uniref:Uncharacterized protein n=1 Tax=Tranquillimonas rosea TaxID=641238 RepID=A0A1H9Q8S8_9RHOB|nr:hypothetical protein [Tranquillimonas rosea]SER56802.1 hypothetical protein SAMN04490244_101509 [Tranquillimonas rosea]
MEALVWGGAALSLLGLAGLVWCIVEAWRARRAGLTDEALRARLQRLVAWNLGALAISALGLMMCLLGVILS